MRKDIFQGILLGIAVLSLIFLSSCGGGPNPNPNPSGSLLPPTNVHVVRDNDGGLRVSWSGVSGAISYQLLRKEGDGAFTPIANSLETTNVTDPAYTKYKTVQYAVKALNQTEISIQSESNIISEQVQNISASKMEFSNQIKLRWAANPENPNFYRIYRYSPSNNNEEFTTTDSFYLDKTAAFNEIHYYRVTWVKDDIEYGSEVELVYGVRGADSDVFEDNDAQDHPALLIKQNSSIAYTYSLSDHSNAYETDTDWYKYHRNNTEMEMLIVKVNLPPNSPFNRKLKLQFYKNGFPTGNGNILNEGENKPNQKLEENDTDISFKVEPFGLTGTEGIGSYTIELL